MLALEALINRRPEFARNVTAGDRRLEHEAGAGLAGLDVR
jgi:hypothetical protein